MIRKVIFILGIVALAGVVISAVIMKENSGSSEKKQTFAMKGGRPLALSKHLDKLSKTIPGVGGESGEGPAGRAAWKLQQLAYPDKDIPLARVTKMRAGFRAIQARTAGRSTAAGAWESIGPTNAVLPKFKYIDATLYLPGGYVAAGRTTSMAIGPTCTKQNCRIYIGTAGGGVWRTDNALAKKPVWIYLSSTFDLNSIGSIELDPNDATGNTILAGTGEGNASGDSCHGVGLYKSTDGGNTWTGPLGSAVFNGRSVATIAVKPGDSNTIYAGVVRSVHGVSSVSGGGVSIAVPGAAIWGLYKTIDGGANWTLVHNGAVDLVGCADAATVALNGTQCSPRGVRNVKVDPSDTEVVYASSYGRGVWRSPDEGATWEQIHAPLNAALSTDRAEIAITTLVGGETRMYIGHGHTASGGQYSRLFRSDDVRTGTPTFTDLTSDDPANPGYGSFNYCTGQCWYDNLVVTPPGHPDVVYLGGSYNYDENDPFHASGWLSNGRGVVYSTDAGASFTDMSFDSKGFLHPNGLHPDHHAIVVNPNNPIQFFEGSDGGVVRSNGKFTDVSSNCASRGLDPVGLARCQQLLSAVPSKLEPINVGLNTLQFQSLSVNPRNSNDLQGGTQDNGTWESYGKTDSWINTMIGDGGQSTFDIEKKKYRTHTFFIAQVDANFKNGDIADWNWISDPFFISGEGGLASFYIPLVNDPVVSETLFAGALHVWRTKTFGKGSMSVSEVRQHCNEWTGDFSVICGDWEALGVPTLTTATLGDRAGGFVTANERATSDSSTLWAATSLGRVFVSKNADGEPASAVTFARIDDLSLVDPGRFVTGIFVDPSDPNHAWISYSGFSAATPLEQGHVFSVNYDPIGGTATWTSLDGAGAGSLGDIPINDIVLDSVTGDLYASCDFGVFKEAAGGGIEWLDAAPGLPKVEVPGLTIVSADRLLYAATHGLGAWRLKL